MEHGKIILNVAVGTPGPSQVIAQNVGNRLYRITNNGEGDAGSAGTMRIQVVRTFFGFNFTTFFELASGRSVDVWGSTISVLALDVLELAGTYDSD